jgi:hypothetical protein
LKSAGRFGTNSRPRSGREVLVETLNGSPVEGLQQYLRIGGGSKRRCRIAKVRRTRGVPTNR